MSFWKKRKRAHLDNPFTKLYGRPIRWVQLPPTLRQLFGILDPKMSTEEKIRRILTLPQTPMGWLEERIEECSRLDMRGIPREQQDPFKDLPVYEERIDP